MIGTQFYTNTLDISHPCHYTLQDPTRHRLKTPPSSPALYYSNIFRTIPPTTNNTPLIKHIHTIITRNYLNTRQPNHLLNEQPPDIANTQNTLPRKIQITLSRLRSGHHPNLQAYKHRFNIQNTLSPTCQRCMQEPDTTEHLLLSCPTLTHHRTLHHISSLRDLWLRPAAVAEFLKAVWPFQ